MQLTRNNSFWAEKKVIKLKSHNHDLWFSNKICCFSSLSLLNGAFAIGSRLKVFINMFLRVFLYLLSLYIRSDGEKSRVEMLWLQSKCVGQGITKSNHFIIWKILSADWITAWIFQFTRVPVKFRYRSTSRDESWIYSDLKI